jgi:hypothetical protein
MAPAKSCLTLCAALLALAPSAHANSQAQMAESCKAEIKYVEARIAKARELPEYRSEEGRTALVTADRWLYQARKHAIKGETRNCVSAAQKSRALL